VRTGVLKSEWMPKTENNGRIPGVQRLGFAILGAFALLAAFWLGILFFRGFSGGISDPGNAFVILICMGICLGIASIGVANLYYAVRRK
jgi:hypothetical protein